MKSSASKNKLEPKLESARKRGWPRKRRPLRKLLQLKLREKQKRRRLKSRRD